MDSYLDGRPFPTPDRFDQTSGSPLPGARGTQRGACQGQKLATALPDGQPESARDAPPSFNGFGLVPGVLPGRRFADRGALVRADVHRRLMTGIAGSEKLGAEPVVLGGEHSGDDDHGDVITYTGEGAAGRDQQLTRGNAAPATSASARAPVRPVRRITDVSGGGQCGARSFP
ncbi:YDG/SRA domain-containing protein [Streptomyces sp. DT20]|uniref:YDG/SRA domain-containing protein n=1 Tax=unclassified Streptomyces TaxID=2593676 RepID=UPI0037F5A3A5